MIEGRFRKKIHLRRMLAPFGLMPCGVRALPSAILGQEHTGTGVKASVWVILRESTETGGLRKDWLPCVIPSHGAADAAKS